MPNGIPKKVLDDAEQARQMAQGSEAGRQQGERAQDDTGNQDPEPPKQHQQEASEGAASQPGNAQELDQPLPPSAPEGSDEAKWEARYKTLKGKYDSEIARLNREIRGRDQQIEELQKQLQEVQSSQHTSDPTPPSDSTLKQIEEDYGAEEPLVQELKRQRQESEALRQQNEQLQNQVKQIQGAQQQTAEQRFWAELNEQVPDWELINQRSEWLSWLGQVDSVSGEMRQTLLERHQQQGNAQGVAALFDAFLREHPQVQQELRQPRTRQQQAVQEQVEPPRTGESGAERPETYPLSEYRQFMTDVTKGKYSRQEAQRLHQLYQQALAEGRIDYSR